MERIFGVGAPKIRSTPFISTLDNGSVPNIIAGSAGKLWGCFHNFPADASPARGFAVASENVIGRYRRDPQHDLRIAAGDAWDADAWLDRDAGRLVWCRSGCGPPAAQQHAHGDPPLTGYAYAPEISPQTPL